jgi:hypothetical protein
MNAQPKPPKTIRKSKHITNPPVPEGSECWACGMTRGLQTHEMFGGANRNKSIEHGLQVYLCEVHHTGILGVHTSMNGVMKDALKRYGQEKFEQTHTRDEFMRLFGKSWL